MASRNPMYLGGADSLISHAAVRGSLKVLIPTGLFSLGDRSLPGPCLGDSPRELLGAEYERNAKRTPRWVSRASLSWKKTPRPSEHSSGAVFNGIARVIRVLLKDLYLGIEILRLVMLWSFWLSTLLESFQFRS